MEEVDKDLPLSQNAFGAVVSNVGKIVCIASPILLDCCITPFLEPWPPQGFFKKILHTPTHHNTINSSGKLPEDQQVNIQYSATDGWIGRPFKPNCS